MNLPQEKTSLWTSLRTQTLWKSLLTKSTVVVAGVAVVAGGAVGFASSGRDGLLTEVEGLDARVAALTADLARSQDALEKKQDDLAALEKKIPALEKSLREQAAAAAYEAETKFAERDLALQQRESDVTAREAAASERESAAAQIQPFFSAPAPAPSTAYYKNCTEARAAGAAPVWRGDPGYGSHLDRDGDGVGCE